MYNLISLPESWVNLMASIRTVMPSAYLAGGAIRDFDNGRPIKDFDVFFMEPDIRWNDLDVLLEKEYTSSRHCNGAYIDAASEVIGSFTYSSLTGGIDLNFVQLDPSFNPADIIERVDFGLCQIGYDLLGVVKTPAYDYDKAHGVLTLTRAETVPGVQRSLKRYERLTQKYQGWPLNVPAEFKELYRAALKANDDELAAAASEGFSSP